VNELARIDDLASAWFDAWSGTASFEACCTPDVQYEDPVVHDPAQGIDALERHARRLRDAFPDLRIERTGKALADEAFACIPWRIVGTHKNGTPTFPATNRFLSLHGLHYLELTDGRVRRVRGFFDLYDASTQLGLLPARGGIGESVLLMLRGFGLRAG
jgi:steroid delta-isomerase-like uncharacterized protein